MRALSNFEIERFNKYGFFFPFDALNESEVAVLNIKINKTIAQLGGDPNALKRGKLNEQFDFIDEISKKKNILDVVEDLLGPNILCWAAGIFSKPQFSNLFTDWHQDYYYWGLSPSDAITVWIALSDTNSSNGCMKFIEDEKYYRELAHVETFNQNSMLSHGQCVTGLDDNVNEVKCILSPGQASVHHINAAHSSEPNTSKFERRGLVLRYIASHVNQTKYENDTAVLVRGKEQRSNIKIVPGPLNIIHHTKLEY